MKHHHIGPRTGATHSHTARARVEAARRATRGQERLTYALAACGGVFLAGALVLAFGTPA